MDEFALIADCEDPPSQFANDYAAFDPAPSRQRNSGQFG
jgi:hypothetical protein